MRQLFATLSVLATLACIAIAPVAANHRQAFEDTWTGFRASGNEPFWSLTFGETLMSFEHLGSVSAQALRTDAQVTFDGTVFMSRTVDGEQRDFIVLVEDQLCSDSMSGRPYPKSVRVFVEGQHFSGCGGDTQDLLGGDWKVTSLGGTAVPDSTDQNFQFDGAGAISGNGGCNRFTGSYELHEGIEFGPIASTRRACINPEISTFEHQLFTVLGTVISLDVAEDGVLTLFDENGPVLTAQR